MPQVDAAKTSSSRPVDLRRSNIDRPGATLRFLFRGLFAAIRFDEADIERIRAAAKRGPVVYVLSTVSYLELTYFNYALRHHDLPLMRFANGGVRTVWLWPLLLLFRMLLAIWRLLRGAKLESEENAMVRHLKNGDPVLLFLRPPKRVIGDARAAANVRGDFTDRLIELSRKQGKEKPLQLVPMTMLWGDTPIDTEQGALDAVFGESIALGRLRAFYQFVRHHRRSVVKVAPVVDLPAFLDNNGERSDEALARTLRFVVSGRIEVERRVVRGPPTKSPRHVRLEVLRTRSVREAIERAAEKQGQSILAVTKKADKMTRRIAANPKRWALALLAKILTFVFGRIYQGIDIADGDLSRLREAAKKGPLVLLPCHKSHIDYLLLSFVFYQNSLSPPHIAAGANLSFFPLGFMFRRCAAFFLRRTFRGDALYAAVFSAYVRRLLRSGFNIEFFIEGGRTRTGKLLTPKLGLLRMMSDTVLDGYATNTQLVPIAINYEKVVEDKSYVKELAGGEKEKEDMGALLRARRVLSTRYGRIDVQVGRIFSLKDALGSAGAEQGANEAAKKRAVERLGHRIRYDIARATAVTPSALVAAAALARGTRGLQRKDLRHGIDALSKIARISGARFSAALNVDFEGAVDRALDLFESDNIIELRGAGDDQLVIVPDTARTRLEYYKNNMIHSIADAAIVARAIGLCETAAMAKQMALDISRVLKHELVYRPGGRFDDIYADTHKNLVDVDWIDQAGQPTDKGRQCLPVLAGLVESYLDAYAIVAKTARDHPALTARRDLLSRSLLVGERALILGDIARPEALCRPYFDGAADYLVEQNALGNAAKVDAILAQIETMRQAPLSLGSLVRKLYETNE